MASIVRRSHDGRRTEIADAALRITATRGISALTVAMLAQELGLTGGALYRGVRRGQELGDVREDVGARDLVPIVPVPCSSSRSRARAPTSRASSFRRGRGPRFGRSSRDRAAPSPKEAA